MDELENIYQNLYAVYEQVQNLPQTPQIVEVLENFESNLEEFANLIKTN